MLKKNRITNIYKLQEWLKSYEKVARKDAVKFSKRRRNDLEIKKIF